MSVGPSNIETEIKLRAPSAAAAAELLTTNGFTLSKPRVYERNSVFDTASGELRSSGRLLRVREAGGVCNLTFKAPASSGRHKQREELEVEVSSAPTLLAIVQRLGYRRTFLYEKFRTEFQSDASDEGQGKGGTGVLDETPIGVFLELEGDARWIDESAARLGFRESDYITASYGRLYLDWCAEHDVAPGDMVWANAESTQP